MFTKGKSYIECPPAAVPKLAILTPWLVSKNFAVFVKGPTLFRINSVPRNGY